MLRMTFAAIPPPLSLDVVTDISNPFLYEESISNSRYREYFVDTGAEFAVNCSSVETTDYVVGNVTWYKNNSAGIYNNY